jgi:hypothetical protein
MEFTFNAQGTEELSSSQKEVTQLEVELDAALRERESLKVELSIQMAKHESNLKRVKAEANMESEKNLEERLA